MYKTVTLTEAKERWSQHSRGCLNSAGYAAFARDTRWYTDGLGRAILQGIGSELYFVRNATGHVYATFDVDARNES